MIVSLPTSPLHCFVPRLLTLSFLTIGTMVALGRIDLEWEGGKP